MKNVIIIYGGKSCEHDISIITACLAKGYFADYNLYCVYFDKNNRAFLVPDGYSPAMHVNARFKQQVVFLTGERAIGVVKRGRVVKRIPVDVAVNCCHGRYGEDGTVAALCGLLNVPLVGSDVTSSAIAMDKILSKRVLRDLQIPVVDGFETDEDNVDRLRELSGGFKYPLIVKPNTLGSSIGVAVCKNFDELSANVSAAFDYDGKVLVEEALTDFCELNCAAMRVTGAVQTSRVDVPVTKHDILTFEDKYVNGGSYEVKPKIADSVIGEAKSLTERIYTQLGFAGVIRVDYLYDNVGKKLYVNEINSIPGSLAYGLFGDVYSLTEYGNLLVEQAERDFERGGKRTTAFSSSVLTQGKGKHGKK